MSARVADRIRRDLERRGVEPGFSDRLSRRLVAIVEPLEAEAYEAVLTSVSHACRAQGLEQPVAEPLPAPDLDPTSLKGLEEVQRLLGAFTGELQKLEEALETLSAYVTRMRAKTVHSRGETLH